MNFIVVGCGRVGAELAFHLFRGGHQVVVVDSRKEAFNRLHPDFRGRTLEGEGLAESVLERAGIREADGLGEQRRASAGQHGPDLGQELCDLGGQARLHHDVLGSHGGVVAGSGLPSGPGHLSRIPSSRMRYICVSVPL